LIVICLPWLEKFADDDPLVFHFASNAIGSQKIDPLEPIGFHISPHPIEGRSIEQHAGVPVVNVLFGEHVACVVICFFSSTSWLSIVPSFCCASVLTRAYSAAFVIHGESIPEDRSVVESSAVDIKGGDGKSVCVASVFSEGQHIYSTPVLS
jgi:hypothetical protein